MTKLNELKDKSWEELYDIVMFGCGRQGKKMYAELNRAFNIIAVVDNMPSKQGELFGEHTVLSFEQAIEDIKHCKTIVTTSQHYYQTIRKQLMEIGLKENIDFVMYQQFISEWYFKYKNRINVIKTDISVTSRCTLNCEHCMQFLPYWKSRQDNLLENIKEDLDIYFKCVDYVFDLDIVGGEPFLYPQLSEVLTYIGEKYRERIGYLGCITNGTIVPKPNVLEIMKKYDIEVSISDYSSNVDYRQKLEKLIEQLEQYQIQYMCNSEIEWYDFGFPKDKYNYKGKRAMAHMKCCNTICHVLDDKKLFYCGQQWAAQKSRLYPSETDAYINLEYMVNVSLSEKQEILEKLMGNIPGGYLQFCQVCGGFGIDNKNRVETAKQYSDKNKKII